MQEYILDSNIVILYSKRHPKIIKLMKNLKKEYFFISVITSIEVLMGANTKGAFEDLNELLHTFAPLSLDTKIAHQVVRLEKKNPKKLKFKDLLIAATAQVEGLTLVTADKDFQKLKGLKVKLVKL